MAGRSTERVSFAAHAARARELANRVPAAADLLRFHAALAEYQQQLSESAVGAVDGDWVVRAIRDLTAWLQRAAPAGVRASVETLDAITAAEWRDLFESYRAQPDRAAGTFSEPALFALEAVLQPVADRLTSGADPRPAGNRCPQCGGLPVVGVLREEGHGARRCLVCGLCLTEWDYRRVVCVKCGEERFEALPVFSAEQVPNARLDACDTCRTYLKTIDATRDGRVVPVVDDLATIALDLWAQEQGYVRIRRSPV